MEKRIEWYVVEREDERFQAIEKLVKIRPEVERLYVAGEWRKELFEKCVAVIGSRRCSNYGRRVVEQLTSGLAGTGYVTVSGFMYGIDIEVHRNTYLSGGKTIAVLGWGIEKKVNVEMSRLMQKLIESGSLVITEYEGDFKGNLLSFPQRNRIVAGLADEVVVVEAAEKSGTMNTVRWAKKMRKRVWAVPGSVLSEVSVGTNLLIKEGKAEMFRFEDNFYTNVLEENGDLEGFSEEEREIITLLRLEEGLGVSEIGRRLGWEMSRVMRVVGKLELKGAVRSVGGVVVSAFGVVAGGMG